jgi:hypothetical protein
LESAFADFGGAGIRATCGTGCHYIKCHATLNPAIIPLPFLLIKIKSAPAKNAGTHECAIPPGLRILKSSTSKVNGLPVQCYSTFHTRKLKERNSLFYLYQLTPSAGSLLTGIEELQLIPFTAFY